MYLLMGSFLSDIQSVQPSASHPLGGELITITGAGLSCDMAVDIDGIPCKVIHSNFSEVKCVTGAAPAGHAAVSEDGTYPSVQEGYRFKGEVHMGVLVESCSYLTDIDSTILFKICILCRWPRCFKQGVPGHWQKYAHQSIVWCIKVS